MNLNMNFDKNGHLDISIRGTLTIKSGVFTFTPDRTEPTPTKPRRRRAAKKRPKSVKRPAARAPKPTAPTKKSVPAKANKLYPTLTLHSTLGNKDVEIDFGDVVKISPGVWGNSILTIYNHATDKTTKRSVVEPMDLLRARLGEFANDWPELRALAKEA